VRNSSSFIYKESPLIEVTGGWEYGGETTHLADWVDSSVADWIKNETSVMEAAWGDMSERSAVAFVHIPP
jgi:hypothetical protein